MAPQEHHAHMLHLPHFFTIIKYVQLVISALVIGLSAFCVSLIAFSAHAYAIFVSLFSAGIIIYFLVASKVTPHTYNCVALLVLEVLAVIFWLATWAVQGALFAALAYIGSYYDSTYYYGSKRSLETRDVYSYGMGYAGCLIAAVALSVINFILYVLTLVYMSRAIHRHRKAGQPFRADDSGKTTSAYGNGYPSTGGAAPDYEKGTSVPMQPMKSNQESYAQQPAPPYPQPQPQQTKTQTQTQVPAESPMEPSRVQSPVSSAYPSEMGMGNHGERHEAPGQRY